MQARTATLNDEAAVSALLAAAYTALLAKDYDATVLAAALPKMTRANPALLNSGTYYVVDAPDGSVIGCGGWTFGAPGSTTQTPGLAHLRHFATHPGFARQGVGRLVYHQCVAAAKLAGATRLQAYATLTAVPFYASNGLALIRHFDVLLGGEISFPSALMEGAI